MEVGQPMSLSTVFFGVVMTLLVGFISFAIVDSELNRCGYLEMRGFWEVLRPNGLCGWL